MGCSLPHVAIERLPHRLIQLGNYQGHPSQRGSMKPGAAVILLLATSGCIHHRIEFGDIQHSISTPKQNAAVVVVIDQATLDQTVDVHSWMTGIAHSWDARPGQMLKQVADVELPQMFSSYEVTPAYRPATGGSDRPLSLQLTVPSYRFENF